MRPSLPAEPRFRKRIERSVHTSCRSGYLWPTSHTSRDQLVQSRTMEVPCRTPFCRRSGWKPPRRSATSTRIRRQPITVSVRMNQVITDVPFGDGDVKLYLDTSSGTLEMEARRAGDARPHRDHRLRHRQEDLRRSGPGGRDAGVHGRQDQGAGRHDEDDGDADRHASGRRSPRPSPARSRTSPNSQVVAR